MLSPGWLEAGGVWLLEIAFYWFGLDGKFCAVIELPEVLLGFHSSQNTNEQPWSSVFFTTVLMTISCLLTPCH